ncbi:MAG: hypothetical protein V4543_12170 [Bacteroidota bacterium]
MKTLLAFLLALTAILQGFSQSLVWEKTYGWKYSDYVLSLERQGAGYIAVVTTDTSGYNYYIGHPHGPINFFPQVQLLKLNAFGDTIGTIKLDFYAQYAQAKTCPDNDILLAVKGVDPFADFIGLRIYKISPEGQIRWQSDCSNTETFLVLTDLCICPDGGALVVGCANPLRSGTGITDGLALRIDAAGNELWRKHIAPGTQTYLYHAELQNHRKNSFLVSGTASPYIYGVWLDSLGNTSGDRLYWADPRGTFFWHAAVQQTPDDNLLVYGSNAKERGSLYYLGKYTPGGRRLWADTFAGTCISPFINSAGNILLNTQDADGHAVKKISSDGYILNTTLLTNNVNSARVITCAAWTNDDSAVFAGNSSGIYPLGDQYYFAKMAGVGNPYITAASAFVSERQDMTVFPNPASVETSISYNVPQNSGRALISVLEMATGRLIAQYPVENRQGRLSVSTEALVPGIYMLRFDAEGLSSVCRKLAVVK